MPKGRAEIDDLSRNPHLVPLTNMLLFAQPNNERPARMAVVLPVPGDPVANVKEHQPYVATICW